MSGSATQTPKAAETEAERIARMEQEIRDYHAAQRKRAEDLADEQLKPITDLAAMKEFTALMAKATEARDKLIGSPEIFNLLNSMITMMEHIPGATDRARQALIQKEQPAQGTPLSPPA